MKTVKYYIAIGVLIACILASSAYSQGFWYGDNIGDCLSEEDAQALHEFLTAPPEDDMPFITKMLFSMFRFNNNPDGVVGVTIYKPEKCWNGYTLLSCLGGYVPYDDGVTYATILIDMNGEVVNQWALVPFPAQMLSNGSVIGGEGLEDPFSFVPALVQQDWYGNEEWRWEGASHDAFVDPCGITKVPGFHHDHVREGNPVGYYAPGLDAMSTGGKSLILSACVPSLEVTQHISKYPLLDNTIYEVGWDGEIFWEWHAYQHFDQMGFSDAAKEAIMNNICGVIPGGGLASDYLHGNTVNYVGPNKWYDDGDLRFNPDNIIYDSRNSNFAIIIARNDHPDGDWKSGDIIWKIGPDYSPGNPEYKLQQIIGMHHAHIIPQSLPGAGNMMIFDNGGWGGYGPLFCGLPPVAVNTFRNYSRVIEFNPVTLDIVWEYKSIEHPSEGEAGPRKFFSPLISNAQRLENGNTLITEGNTGRVFEITPDKEIVWEFYNPFSGGNTGLRIGGNAVYRAYRVPASWLPEGAEN